MAFWGRVSSVRVNDRLDLGVGEFAGLAGAGRIAQRAEPALQESLPPLAHGREGHPAFGGDGGVAQSGGAIQDDAGPLGCALVGLGPPCHQFELGLLLGL